MNNIIVIVSIQRTASTEQCVLKTDKHTDTHTQTIWAIGTTKPRVQVDVQETGKIKSAEKQMDLFCCGVSAVCHSCTAPDSDVLKKTNIPFLSCRNLYQQGWQF